MYQVSHVTTAYSVPGMIPICCTRHPSPTTKNHKHTYDSTTRLLCARLARQSFVLTHKRDSSSTSTTIIKTATAAAQQQHSSSSSSKGGGDLTSPATTHVPDFKNKGKRQNKTYQSKKIRSHNGCPLFLMQLFLEPQNHKNNRQK